MKLLVLDLDETLIYATKAKLAVPESFKALDYLVYKRPHLDSFITEMKKLFKIGIWTAAGDVIAEEIVSKLLDRDALEFVLTSNDCTVRMTDSSKVSVVKNLRKLKNKGYSLDEIIVVDDTPSKYEKNYGNLVHVHEFVGDQNDDELLKLAAYLKHLNNYNNIRTVEKRNWRLTAIELMGNRNE